MTQEKIIDKKDKLPLRERISYFFSDFGHQGVMWNFMNAYFLYFLTDILEISTGAAGVLILIVTIFDAVNDPLIGWVCDRTKTRFGTYRPYIIGFAIPMGLVTFLCFVAPDFTYGGRLLYAYVIYILFTVVGTFTGCSFGALPAVMTEDSQQRVVLGTFRDFGANFGGFLYNLVAASLLTYFSKSAIPNARGYSLFAFCVGCWVAVCLLICGFGCREHVTRTYEKTDLLKSLKSLLKNKPAICLILMVVCINCLLAVRGSLSVYYCIHYLGNYSLITPIMTLMFTTPVVGLFFVPKVVSLIGKKNMFYFSAVCGLLSAVLMLIAHRNLPLIYVASLLNGLTVTGVFATIWGTMPDCADYGEWKTGVFAPGVITAMATFATKVGSGLANFIVSRVLTFTGYDAALEVQSEFTINGLYWCACLAPAILSVLAILCIIPFDLTPEKMDKIHAELAVIRAERNNTEEIQ